MISITSDLDWAPEHVINFFLELLDKYCIKATIFCTHKISTNRHELGIHPNVQGSVEDKKIIKKFLSYVPNAKGVRAHGLFNYSNLFGLYKELGLEYESSYVIPLQNVKPFMRYPGILEIPISFEDDAYFLQHNRSFKLKELMLNKYSHKALDYYPPVFNFHPIHIFLNTETIGRYTKSKQYLHKNPDKLKNFVNFRKRGTRDLFIDLLEYISKNEIQCHTLGEINRKIRRIGPSQSKRYS